MSEFITNKEIIEELRQDMKTILDKLQDLALRLALLEQRAVEYDQRRLSQPKEQFSPLSLLNIFLQNKKTIITLFIFFFVFASASMNYLSRITHEVSIINTRLHIIPTQENIP